jgi:hypothetical protein
VQGKHFGPYEATCEMEDAMKQTYPFLFTAIHTEDFERYKIEDDVPLRGGIVIHMFPPVWKYKYDWTRDYGGLDMC